MRPKPNDAKKLPSGSGGFSLLELLACMAVLAVAIGMFLAAISENVQLEAMNSETNIALNAAIDVIESVRSMTYGQINSTTVPPTFEASGLASDGRTIRLTASSGSTLVGQAAVTENAEQTSKTVHVRVLWRSITGSDRSVALMTEVTSY